jgi:enoyl-CoA hydratase/carnithine racemase
MSSALADSTTSDVAWEVIDSIGVLTLNRPDSLNAIRTSTIDDLRSAVIEATQDTRVRALVLTGAGRAFSAGADVKEWASADGAAESLAEPWVPKMHTLMGALYWMPKPVIAAVNGVAVGAGCDLTLVSDIRVGSTKARFGEVYMRLGFCPDAGGSFLLPRIVGESRAAEMIYTGRIIDAQEALAIGLVSRLEEPGELISSVMEQAAQLASGPTVAIGIAKHNIRKNALVGFEEALRNEVRGGEICGRTEDHVEGLAATVERRDPHFVGR